MKRSGSPLRPLHMKRRGRGDRPPYTSTPSCLPPEPWRSGRSRTEGSNQTHETKRRSRGPASRKSAHPRLCKPPPATFTTWGSLKDASAIKPPGEPGFRWSDFGTCSLGQDTAVKACEDDQAFGTVTAYPPRANAPSTDGTRAKGLDTPTRRSSKMLDSAPIGRCQEGTADIYAAPITPANRT